MLDTSIGTGNMGDHIIMECIRSELAPILDNSFVYNMSTHLTSFNELSVLKNFSVVEGYSSCDLKFAGGTNLLVKNLLHPYPQWNVNKITARPFVGTVLVGVGAGAGDKTNSYTQKLYRKMLSHEYYHSVRDERSKQYVEQLGLKAINTGCATMWMLTPDFCSTIPKAKASRVVFTLTARIASKPVDERDQQLIDILLKNYDKVYYWVQGEHDFAYFNRLKNTENITVLPPSLKAYDRLLCEDDLDYVGTRLHGGIYAMRHRKRAIIISVDERASSINESNNLNCITKDEIGTALEEKINASFATEIRMPLDKIKEWKAQFSD